MAKLSHNKCLVEIAVPLPIFNTFTYRSRQQYFEELQVGMRVLVPFGKRRLTGYVVGFPDSEPQQDIKEIYDVLDKEPLFGEDDLRFYNWAAGYYYHPIGQTIKTALPGGLNTEYSYAVSITEEGKELLKNPPSELQGLPVLRELEEGTEVSLKNLEKRIGRQGLNYHIRLLKEKKFIQLSLKKRGATIRIRKEKWFFPAETEIELPLKGKQKEIFTFINEKGDVSYTLLKQHFGNCAGSLKSLEKKGAISVEEREVFRKPPMQEEVFTEPVHKLSPDQAEILKNIGPAVKQRKFYPFLLYGVTGSGKTEIYLKVMEQVLKSGRQCLYMVPEISLTLQLCDRISSRLKTPITMLHSSLTSAERFDAWRMIRRGDAKIVLGVRSAIFASFSDLGAVIVDEEHDPSYKQDEKLHYNARDLSLLKGKLSGCIVVLGSATPSLESFHNSLKKKYFIGTLNKRIEDRPLPRVRIIDMKAETRLQKKKSGIISRQLHEALQQRLSDGRQSLLLLNRRGFSPAFICQQCGYTFRCPNCDVSLINHRGQKKLCCHYCDFSMPLPEECPECGSYFLCPLGWGTERLEKEIKRLFPDARIARMDRDTTASRGAAHAIIKDLYCGETDILAGTQMIAKSYHLPKVTLVGVICADQSLNFPDYRASERTFQLLTQVAGRAGREDFHGEVLIQSYNPDHYTIACAQGHDYRKFYEIEMGYRKDLGYPPYKKIINIRFEGPSKKRVEACSREIGNLGRQLLESSGHGQAVEILGPTRAPWEKIKGRYRYQMLLKASSIQRLRSFTSSVMEQSRVYVKGSGVKLVVDVDPLFIM